MANTPAWFNKDYYLTSKLAQLRAAGETKYNNIVDVAVALEAAGFTAYEHFQQYSLIERTSPNPAFNATEYLNAKAAQLGNGATADFVALAIREAGMNLWEHFQKYGWKEGVNPSNSFDVKKYMESKLAQLQKAEPDAGWTAEKLEEAFSNAGIDPVSHYDQFGKSEEGVVVSPAENPVPSDGRTDGEVFTLTVNEDNLTGTALNDTFNAPAVDVAGTLTQTLQSVDRLDGGAGTDTLSATVNSGGTVTPTLVSVENVTLRSVVDGSGLDFSAATGVQKITVANSVATAALANVGSYNSIAVENQTKQVDVTGSTATSLNLTFNKFGTTTATSTINVNTGTATSATVASTDSNVSVGTLASLKSLTVDATGANKFATASSGAVETLTVSGKGSLDVTSNLTALKTLTSTAEGAIKVTGMGAAFESATTGGGNDSITIATATGVKTVSTGAGNDTVNVTGALGATAVVDLGAGDDTLVLNSAPTAGVTLTGGDGKDTLQTSQTIYTTNIVGGFTAPQIAKISGFEVLSISTALANASTVNVAGISGITSFVAAAGVAAGGSANVTNLGANASVEIAGNNTGIAPVNAVYTLDLAGAAATAGGQNVTIDGVVAHTSGGAEDDATIAAAIVAAGTITLSDGVTYNITAGASATEVVLTAQTAVDTTGSITVAVTGGTQPTTAAYVPSTDGVTAAAAGTLVLSQATDTGSDVIALKLNNNYTENNDGTATVTALTNTVTASKIETLNVESTGKASTAFKGDPGTKADGVNNTLVLTNDDLVTLNVSGDQAFTFASVGTMTKLVTIDASANTAGVTIDASAALATSPGLTIKGTEKADVITGGLTGDTITLGAGNDIVAYDVGGASKIGTGTFDTITDFNANTFGNGTNGAAGTGAGAQASWTGDVLRFTGDGGAGGVVVDVLANAVDATTFLANNAGSAAGLVAALDSSTGNLYVDNTNDGVADYFIQLTGVTTIDAAAFVVV